MCATCGCGKPKDKHGMKTVAAANKKYEKKESKGGKKSAHEKGESKKAEKLEHLKKAKKK